MAVDVFDEIAVPASRERCGVAVAVRCARRHAGAQPAPRAAAM
jgi:hypothetical protein